METMERISTDKRIDDLRADVGHRFNDVGRRFDDLKADMDHRFEAVDQRFERLEGETSAGFAQLNARFDGLYNVLVGAAGVIIAALIGLIATQL